MIVGRVVTNYYINPDALLKIFQHVWIRKVGIELKALDQSTFLLYFKEIDDIELVLFNSPWNFNNSLMIGKRLEYSVHLSHIYFDSLPCWLQLHNLPLK